MHRHNFATLCNYATLSKYPCIFIYEEREINNRYVYVCLTNKLKIMDFWPNPAKIISTKFMIILYSYGDMSFLNNSSVMECGVYVLVQSMLCHYVDV